jgi:hypothetical protein
MTAAGLPSADMAVYMINCIYNVQNILGLYEFTDQRLEALSTQVVQIHSMADVVYMVLLL